ncbi:hypothetical protein J5N97_000952 [Dioscorea zingiberensis]|uniref:Uncharacterized protein n=1 Tax=Dioscorea zingiberensis TaxID=325984 RepID=A0A9D5H2P3_9LILI|nr:hypothetical protein J5N97_000952 [Dioscorea zingiberensis]
MAWRGSISRSLLAAARSPSASLRHPSAAPRVRRAIHSGPSIPRRLAPLAPPRSFGRLGCVQSLLPLHSAAAAARLTSHLSISVRACCELSQGKNGKDG